MIMQQTTHADTAGARTSDWLDQLTGKVIYAFDLSAMFSPVQGNADFTKGDFELGLKKASRRRNLPVGEHIRETIDAFKQS
jgi:hypothetical protein